MAVENQYRDMSDEPDRQDIEDRVDQLEQTIAKMLPSRRDALKLGGAALVGGAAMSGAASGQPGDQDGEAGVIGTDNSPVDIEASDIEVDDLVVNGTATGVAQDLQGCRVFLSAEQSISAGTPTQIEFDDVVYDSASNYDTTNHTFTCPETGLYFANLNVTFKGGGNDEIRRATIGNASTDRPSNEGSFVDIRNSDPFDVVQPITINKYAQGDTIAGYAENLQANDILDAGNQGTATFMEIGFLGSL